MVSQEEQGVFQDKQEAEPVSEAQHLSHCFCGPSKTGARDPCFGVHFPNQKAATPEVSHTMCDTSGVARFRFNK